MSDPFETPPTGKPGGGRFEIPQELIDDIKMSLLSLEVKVERRDGFVILPEETWTTLMKSFQGTFTALELLAEWHFEGSGTIGDISGDEDMPGNRP